MSRMPPGSQIFVGFRALGFHCNHVPLALRYHQRHKDHYVVTSVGKSFHTYNCSKLGIVSVSNTHPSDIRCIAADAFLVFTACQNIVRAFTQGRQVLYTYIGHDKDVHLLLPFGDHLVSVDEDSLLKIWDIKSAEIYLEIQFDNRIFEATALMHPTTYLNKILVGSRQGTMQIWNIKSNKLVYSFSGWGSPITAIEQAPAVDVVAVGLEDGRIVVHNLKYDETIVTFTQEWGPVTAISFRTDGHPIMATGSPVGHIALWNLEEKCLQAQMRDAHKSGIAGMRFLSSEPVLVTNSADNSLKMWIFDQPDGSGRLLRVRAGHSLPPAKIRFYGDQGQNILSAGQDSTLKSFSTLHEKHNKDLGQANLKKTLGNKKGVLKQRFKMAAITHFAAEKSRESEWDSIAACHQGTAMVTTWNYQRSTMGKHKLTCLHASQATDVEATAIDISSCGNFVLVGWSTGHVDTYNIQSGIHRGSYGNPKAHDGAIRGLVIDGLNQVVITGSLDSKLKFWKFKLRKELDSLALDAPVNQLLLHRDSSMLAISMDNFVVVIVDADLRRIVRRFKGHLNRITDMAFSQDARWLVTSSMDSTIRTWDLPSSRLIDSFLVEDAATSLTLSPTGDFLATTHVDDLGVYLWSNKTLYAHVPIRPLPDTFEPSTVALPGTHLQPQDIHEIDSDEDQTVDLRASDLVSEFKSPQQISAELVTLSLLPNSRWKSLTNLELIKQRNKPKEPPKVPKSAPFFLPTIAGLTPKFAALQDDDDKDKGKVKSMSLPSFGQQSRLSSALERSVESQQFDPILGLLKSWSPSEIDVELRSLSQLGGGSTDALQQFLRFLGKSLQDNLDFELLQAYMTIFLKLHGNEIANEPVLAEEVRQLAAVQQSSWQRIQAQFNKCLCLIAYMKNPAV
ncbi:WD repeat-containing protein 36-like [Patiria miniata]|uniref:Small-subunit processome Utp21 domain-containing protein n=1 Tax=Patiria miniata TaxID=46514 RepID=A0A914AXP1_PATMI|nr:WD repeat-containing protein 36-like [Patiria miniata]